MVATNNVARHSVAACGDWVTSRVPSVSAYSSTLECPAGITSCRTMYNKDKRYVFYEVILFCELHSGSRFVGGLSGVKSMGVPDWAGEVLALMDSVGGLGVVVLLAEDLAVMVLAHPAQVSAGAAFVRDSAGRVDLRVEAFLVGQIAVASVIAVSVGEIAAFAIVGFAISKGTLSILASMALDIQIIINTTTPITTHTRITTTMPI